MTYSENVVKSALRKNEKNDIKLDYFYSKWGSIVLLTFTLMSDVKKKDYYHAGYKKKRNKKRQASSPLNDNAALSVSSDNNRLSKDQSRKCKKVLDNTSTRSN